MTYVVAERPTTLAEVFVLVQTAYPFTSDTHPRLAKNPSHPKLLTEVGVIQHCLNHLHKSTIGPIAGTLEQYDHGSDFDTEAVEIALAKALVNIVKISEVLGLEVSDLCRRTPNVMLGVEVAGEE